MHLNRKLILLGAFLATLAGIAGCLKAGDGIGLTEDGKPDPCYINPKSKACTTYTCRNGDTTIPMCKVKTGLSFALKIYPILGDKGKDGCFLCHSGTGQGVTFLNLSNSSIAYDSLINKLVWGQTREQTRSFAPGWKRVVPGRPDSSMLYLKLYAGTYNLPSVHFDSVNFIRGYGAPMPLNNSGAGGMSKENLELVRKWILDGALP